MCLAPTAGSTPSRTPVARAAWELARSPGRLLGVHALLHAVVLSVLAQGGRLAGMPAFTVAWVLGVGGLSGFAVLLVRIPTLAGRDVPHYGRYGLVNLLLSGGLLAYELAAVFAAAPWWGLVPLGLGWWWGLRVLGDVARWAPGSMAHRLRWCLRAMGASAVVATLGAWAPRGLWWTVWAGFAGMVVVMGAALWLRRSPCGCLHPPPAPRRCAAHRPPPAA